MVPGRRAVEHLSSRLSMKLLKNGEILYKNKAAEDAAQSSQT
jgi:hypothetical protein